MRASLQRQATLHWAWPAQYRAKPGTRTNDSRSFLRKKAIEKRSLCLRMPTGKNIVLRSCADVRDISISFPLSSSPLAREDLQLSTAGQPPLDPRKTLLGTSCVGRIAWAKPDESFACCSLAFAGKSLDCNPEGSMQYNEGQKSCYCTCMNALQCCCCNHKLMPTPPSGE